MHGTLGPDAGPAAPLGQGPDEAAPITRIVAEVAAAFPGERISLGEMATAFGERAFGMLLLLLLLPGLLPGMASVFGTPLLILGIQMGLGFRKPKLPGILARQTIKRADLLRLASASSKGLGRIERYVRPRAGFWTRPYGERIIGWLTAYVAIMLILPGPGTNGPPAFGNIVMALGVIEQDNRTIGWGVGLTILGCAFATVVLGLFVWLGVEAFGYMF